MLKSHMFVPGDFCAGLETEERGGGAVSGFLVDPVRIDPFPEGSPSQLVLVFGNVEDILKDEGAIER